MTNTQNSSFAATVLDALSKIGSYHTGYLKAVKSEGVIPAEYNAENIGEVWDLIVEFRPGSIAGITVGHQLDKALVVNNVPHKVHIDWDKDLLVYTHAWENYSVHNWAEDPSMLELPIMVKFTGVTLRHLNTVLTTFLDAIAPVIVDKAPEPPKHPRPEASEPGVVKLSDIARVMPGVVKLSDITRGY